MLGIAGTLTLFDISARGISRTVTHPASASTGDGSVSRYRPSQPVPVMLPGFAVFQMSVPVKCDRLELGYPVR